MKKSLILLTLVSFAFFSGHANAATNTGLHREAPADSLLNIPAPAFSLKDLNGKTVRLADYKGKILVLDFWATWCVPCRNSFPIMKTVMAKYQGDPGVQFLFIDTKEVADPKKVKSFLAKNHYPFPVAFDEAGADGKYTTFQRYQLPGIPAKYVIGPDGNIRFQELGFNTNKTTDESVKELSAMIETLRGQ